MEENGRWADDDDDVNSLIFFCATECLNYQHRIRVIVLD